MSRRYNKARRGDAGWVDEEEYPEESSDATTPYGPGSGVDEYSRSTSPAFGRAGVDAASAATTTRTSFAGADDRGLTQSMRINPDPGGFREKYLQTFDGLQGYSKEGVTKLDYLVQQAVSALESSKVPSKSGYRFGAALMTKDGKVYKACNVESSVDSLASSSERTAVLMAATEGHTEFLGLVIASDALEVDFVLPDGTSRQFLAEFGNFGVYVVTSDGRRHQYTTYDLFPSASGRRTPASPMKTRVSKRGAVGVAVGAAGRVRGGKALSEVVGLDGSGSNQRQEPREWAVRDVVSWVEEDLDLPTLGEIFTDFGRYYYYF
jgi:cytidine deaminase